MRLYDLTSPEYRQIASKKIEMPVAQAWRLAHKVADEVVLQFTGELGIADTKIAYVNSASGHKEIYMMDYDGAEPTPADLEPVHQPLADVEPRSARSIAFTSFMRGYPYLYRLFPFEKRPVQLLAGYLGINTSPAWSPDGRFLALTLSKDGNPEIYVLTLATGASAALTTFAGIDTEPTWSPTGREIAFVSDRSGAAQIYVMDAEGANVRRLSQDRIQHAAALVAEGRRDRLHLASGQSRHLGGEPRRLEPPPAHLRTAAATKAHRGRRTGATRCSSPGGSGASQLFTMLADGSEQQQLLKGPGRHDKWLVVATPSVIGLAG